MSQTDYSYIQSIDRKTEKLEEMFSLLRWAIALLVILMVFQFGWFTIGGKQTREDIEFIKDKVLNMSMEVPGMYDTIMQIQNQNNNLSEKIESNRLDLSFQGRMKLKAGLENVQYYQDVGSAIYKITGYSMYLPEYKTKDEEGHIDWDHLDITFVRDVGEKNIFGYSDKQEYIVCKSNDDGVSSRDWSSLADELHDGVINCREGEDGQGKPRPNFERVVNNIIEKQGK